MTNDLDIHPDIIALACAMLSNPEAFKAATRIHEKECFITTDPVARIVEWSMAIASGLNQGQRNPMLWR